MSVSVLLSLLTFIFYIALFFPFLFVPCIFLWIILRKYCKERRMFLRWFSPRNQKPFRSSTTCIASVIGNRCNEHNCSRISNIYTHSRYISPLFVDWIEVHVILLLGWSSAKFLSCVTFAFLSTNILLSAFQVHEHQIRYYATVIPN